MTYTEEGRGGGFGEAETRKRVRGRKKEGERLIKHFANFGKLYIHQLERRGNCLRQILSNASA